MYISTCRAFRYFWHECLPMINAYRWHAFKFLPYSPIPSPPFHDHHRRCRRRYDKTMSSLWFPLPLSHPLLCYLLLLLFVLIVDSQCYYRHRHLHCVDTTLSPSTETPTIIIMNNNNVTYNTSIIDIIVVFLNKSSSSGGWKTSAYIRKSCQNTANSRYRPFIQSCPLVQHCSSYFLMSSRYSASGSLNSNYNRKFM